METTTARRKRQFRERETLILKTARAMIREQGFLDLKMSRLAQAVAYSVGTLYTHFKTKEDLLVALAVQSIGWRATLFERVKKARHGSRDRIYGILIARLVLAEADPAIFDVEQLASSPSIWSRAAPENYRAMVAGEQHCSDIVLSIIRDGLANGDLNVGQVQETDIVFGLWGITVGFHRLTESFADIHQVGLDDASAAVRTNYHLLLDSYGWKPLQGWNPDAVERHFRDHVLGAWI